MPEYLRDKNQNIFSVFFTVLFAIVFLNVYEPFASITWFKISKLLYFIYSIAVIGIAAIILIISRMILYFTRNTFEMTIYQYLLWLMAEVVVTAFLYSVITVSVVHPENQSFFRIFPKELFYTFFVLLIPYAVSTLYAAFSDQNKTLTLLRDGEIFAGTDADDTRIFDGMVHLVDNNGVLRFSVKLDNLYFMESQDNYVKVYYMNQGELKNYMLRCTIKTVEETFAGSPLQRCHRSYIINTDKVRIMRKEKNGLLVDMDSDKIQAIPVSKSYARQILKCFTKNRSFEGYMNNVRKS